jgi:hypothetical protein
MAEITDKTKTMSRRGKTLILDMKIHYLLLFVTILPAFGQT